MKVSPDLAIARANLAIALLYASKNPEAADSARAAVTALPESPTAHYVAGLIAKADNRLDEAAAAFERVLQLDRDDAGAKIQLGQIRSQERKYDEAIPLFQQALSAEPYNVTAAYSLALALTRAGRADEGRQAMQRFDTLRSSAYGVTYAQTYLAQGRYAEALTSTGSERSLVNTSTPAVSFSDAPPEFLSSKPPASPAAGGIALVDIDNDGDLDIVDVEVRFRAAVAKRSNGRLPIEPSRHGSIARISTVRPAWSLVTSTTIPARICWCSGRADICCCTRGQMAASTT